MPTELQIKQQRLGDFLDRHGLDGVLLTRRDNFAWITCGRDNHIANNTTAGVTSILATCDTRICLANAIEAPRMRGEELVGTGIETVEFAWWDADAAKRVVAEVIGGKKIATDSETFGLPLPLLPDAFGELRWSLTDEEIARYRECGKRASSAMELACRAIRPGMDGHEIAGLLDHHIYSEQLQPVVTLVAVDAQVEAFRHPIPKSVPLRKYAMLVTCAQMHGLISCLTRFVHVGPLPKELQTKQQTICNIDAAVNFATKPGRTLGEVFADLRQAYADADFADQWEKHHQGGSTGYNGREIVATPNSTVRVMGNQAFAWNPSITGVKSEDTVLVTTSGVEVLTAASSDWPGVEGRANGKTLRRAGILSI